MLILYHRLNSHYLVFAGKLSSKNSDKVSATQNRQVNSSEKRWIIYLMPSITHFWSLHLSLPFYAIEHSSVILQEIIYQEIGSIYGHEKPTRFKKKENRAGASFSRQSQAGDNKDDWIRYIWFRRRTMSLAFLLTVEHLFYFTGKITSHIII